MVSIWNSASFVVMLGSGVICHPSDVEAWKHFNETHPDFDLEPRNVRLGLYVDGLAPHGQYGKSYSCWPVIITTYNLPPRMCMKSEYMSGLPPGMCMKSGWVDPTKGLKIHPKYHLVDVNHKRLYQKDEPFILAQQAIQVYYAQYPHQHHHHHHHLYQRLKLPLTTTLL
ncbi:UNVERIFIED_CONTAM: hypothetical protein Scaly_2216800 [Sesamum calycinum]|uniref:DUF4216 domain-containing protein n=1 Tax=Sesamum calycinum TaxID=2727403 RepID=A0AAW2M8M3_9LAMI